VPEDIRARAQYLMQQRGPRFAAARLGVSRNALLAVCAGAEVLPGTLALLRESMRNDESKNPA
jgi:hypothetical protein